MLLPAITRNTFVFIACCCLLLACTTGKKDTGPALYPFDQDMASLQLSDTLLYGEGDCIGTLATYTNKDTKLIADTMSCGEYGYIYSAYLLPQGELHKVHTQEMTPVQLENQDTYVQVYTETTYNLAQQPAVVYTRVDTLLSADTKLVKAPWQQVQVSNIDSLRKVVLDKIPTRKPGTTATIKPAVTISGTMLAVDEQTGIVPYEITINADGWQSPYLLATENGFNSINKKAYDTYHIPAEAEFAISTWYSGKGNLYYGVWQQDKLVVYKKPLKQAIPAKAGGFSQYAIAAGNEVAERPHHFICYKQDDGKGKLVIAFTEAGKAIYARFDGNAEQIKLVYTKVETIPGSANYTMYYHPANAARQHDEWVLTHAGIYDYVTIKTVQGVTASFTIDHGRAQDGYPTQPCY